MRLKNTAFLYNVTVQSHSNSDWGTDIGQSTKHTFTLAGFPEVLNAMVYYKIKDVENISIILGRGNRTPKPFSAYAENELVLASYFPKVFVNGRRLKDQAFIMCIVKEINALDSKGKVNVHQGRCTLKFSNSLRYNDVPVNQRCIEAITEAFGVPQSGSWAILDMSIKNEDELHFLGFSLGNVPKDYASTEERNADFEINYNRISPLPSVDKPENLLEAPEMKNQDWEYISAIKTKPFLILGGFSGTGKSMEVKSLAFSFCPCDGVLNVSETTPGNYLLISVKPNWHDATDITGFRSSVNRNYYVTDFMRFLVKAKMYESQHIPFFVCLDEMNLAPVEEYFADFLSVIESRKRKDDGTIVTDAIVPASVFSCREYAPDFNIFMSLGLKTIREGWKADDINALEPDEEAEAFERQDIVEELKQQGLTIPSNVVIIGTVNMDDTTNSFSRKVIDRAMTFETVIGKFTTDYFDHGPLLGYTKEPLSGELLHCDEVLAGEMVAAKRFELEDADRDAFVGFINEINEDLEGSPFKISYRILNESILLYRAKKDIQRIMADDEEFNKNVDFKTDLESIFDDILMQKVLPRIEGDYEKCGQCLNKLKTRAEARDWEKALRKIIFMNARFGKDRSGFTSFWN